MKWTTKVRVSVTREGDFAKVAVADQGIGIPEEQLPLVWEKFYHALAPEAADVAGSGLGLTIVKHIVSMHGGEVDATSEVGQGSVFSFTLPLGRAQ
ncbi:MAG: ATP-binding protein [Verrucomicrobia bacterium]|nr:ATP-binding protein [Verrucomicrobiota bacterium]